MNKLKIEEIKIDIDEKINNINNLVNLINKIDKLDIKNFLFFSLNKELDYCTDHIEELYYQYVLKNNDPTQKINQYENEIINTRKVFNKFMPFILAYQMNNLDTDTDTDLNNNHNINSNTN